MKFTRVWAMPNAKTFSIKPIGDLIQGYTHGASVVVDPFANDCKRGTITNDLDPQYGTTYNMEATEFLQSLPALSADVVLYDPPYSPRQVSEVYKKFGRTVDMKTTQASYWAAQKREISRITKTDGVVITCSWNSGGIGEKYGFRLIEVLLVPHGGWHNDTIVTVEVKTP